MEQELMLDPVKEELLSKQTLCRLCACSSQLLLPIFEGEGLEISLQEIIEKHLHIQVTSRDVLPLQACYHCASTLLSWHELNVTCAEAQVKLIGMFGANETSSTNIQMPPAASREKHAAMDEDFVLGSKDLGSRDPALPSSESMSKDDSDQLQETVTEQGGEEDSKEEDKERFIADVTEENNDVLLEDVQSVTGIENQCQIDHCYSRERQVSETDIRPQQERSRLPSRLTLQSVASRPLSTQPLVNFVPTPPAVSTKSSKPSSVKNSKSQPSTPKIVIVVNKTRTGTSSIAVPIQPVHDFSSPSAAPKRLIPLRPKPPAQTRDDSLAVLPKLKELTVTRVPAGVPKNNSVKPVPRASLTVVRGSSYSCKMCSAKFTNEMIYKRHMYLAHNVMKHKCPLCPNVFGKKMDLQVHIKQTHSHPFKKQKQTCMICKLSFDKVIDLKLHIRDKHRRNVSRFEAAIADRKVILGVALTEKEVEMLKEFHSCVDGKDAYHCQLCKKSWTNLEKTVAHVRTHTKELLYSCDTCGQRFNTRGVMKRHTQIHKNSKPFSCDYCDKAFSSKQNRDDHHRLHTKEVKTVCESCGEFLTSASMLYYHRKIHSGVNPYKCPYCDKAYSIRSLLKRHVRFHTGEKPHLCSVCGRGFKTSGQLRGHSAVHSDDRPFECDGCGAMMKTKKYLKRHTAICANLQAKKMLSNDGD